MTVPTSTGVVPVPQPRELRGVWPGAQPPLDERGTLGAHHLGLLTTDPAGPPWRALPSSPP
jgi:hypothetical protein